MTESTRAIVQAMAVAVRREASARAAAASATTEAREAAQLQVMLLAELRAAGLTLPRAAHIVSVALCAPLDRKGRARMAARYRKRLQRRRGSTSPDPSETAKPSPL